MMSSAPRPGFCRSWNGLSTMNIEPTFDAEVWITNDIPAMPTVCSTPGVAWVISTILAMAASVRWSDAESGSWTPTISRPWSCWGMKPLGALSSVQTVRASRAP